LPEEYHDKERLLADGDRWEREIVAPGPAAKIEYHETQLTLDVLQQRRDVLADVVIARALPRNLRHAGCNVPA